MSGPECPACRWRKVYPSIGDVTVLRPFCTARPGCDDAARAREERIAAAREAFLEAVKMERREWSHYRAGASKDLTAALNASAATTEARDEWLAAEAEEDTTP